jgi:hypothetical protein
MLTFAQDSIGAGEKKKKYFFFEKKIPKMRNKSSFLKSVEDSNPVMHNCLVHACATCVHVYACKHSRM